MNSSFPLMSLKDVLEFEPLMEKYKVSQVARSEKGFLTAYKRNKLDEKWFKKRERFLGRTLVSYYRKPTIRRLLSIYAWAYDPQ